MDQPLGRAIGNALEVAEAVETLRGGGPADLRELSLHLGVELLQLSGLEPDAAAARARLETALASGAALAKLQALVAAQGGDQRLIDDPGVLPQAPFQVPVRAEQSGYVHTIAARDLGYAAIALGAGRSRKGDTIDHATGFQLWAKVGDAVAPGDLLATVHARTEHAAKQAVQAARAAYSLGDLAPPSRPLVAEILR
jgi:pyrimidine-nucleoside phosphorylase